MVIIMKKLKLKLLSLLALVTGLLMSTASYAYLPDETTVLDPMYTEVTADINLLSTKAWPIVFLVTGISIGIGLFKKFTRKAAS